MRNYLTFLFFLKILLKIFFILLFKKNQKDSTEAETKAIIWSKKLPVPGSRYAYAYVGKNKKIDTIKIDFFFIFSLLYWEKEIK